MSATFKVGDAVHSSPESGDDRIGLWEATIHTVKKARCDTPDGYVYETVGKWKGTNQKRPTLRQLWSNHLIKDED